MNPFNFVTLTEYSGRNSLDLLGPDFPAYATFNQIKSVGGKVRKGSHGQAIFCGYREKLDETGKTVRVPKAAYVFHIDQVDLPEDYLVYVASEQAQGKIKVSGVVLNEELLNKIFA